LDYYYSLQQEQKEIMIHNLIEMGGIALILLIELIILIKRNKNHVMVFTIIYAILGLVHCLVKMVVFLPFALIKKEEDDNKQKQEEYYTHHISSITIALTGVDTVVRVVLLVFVKKYYNLIKRKETYDIVVKHEKFIDDLEQIRNLSCDMSKNIKQS
jgi:predicted neutral ceramidase superfamily lipid hydrolase